jgi:hypothetical protein
MTDKKIILRVAFKLMAATAILTLVYIFMAGLFTSPNTNRSASILRIDISAIQAGDIQYFDVGNKKLLVLHRSHAMLARIDKNSAHLFSRAAANNLADNMDERYRSLIPEYFIAYAYEPFYGCAVSLANDVFIPVCINLKYDLSGRVYKHRRAEENLIVPSYELERDVKNKIHLRLYAN